MTRKTKITLSPCSGNPDPGTFTFQTLSEGWNNYDEVFGQMTYEEKEKFNAEYERRMFELLRT